MGKRVHSFNVILVTLKHLWMPGLSQVWVGIPPKGRRQPRPGRSTLPKVLVLQQQSESQALNFPRLFSST